MVSISLKKGYQLPVGGQPSLDMDTLAPPLRVGVHPDAIPFIKPRLMVQTGDPVSIGHVLFVDKRRPDIHFLSPGAGTVEEIVFGPRRRLHTIIIRLASIETAASLGSLTLSSIHHMDRNDLVAYLLKGGVWPFIKQLPFYDIADPDITPSSIIVSLSDLEPFQADPRVYLKSRTDLFLMGLEILKKLCQKLVVTIHAQHEDLVPDFSNFITHHVAGSYPASHPGVILYHTRTTPSDNRAWIISGQDVLMLAGLAHTGCYPTERVIALAGSMSAEPKHILTRIGVPVDHLIYGRTKGASIRCIAGGLFTGANIPPNSFMGFYPTSLTLIPEGNHREFLGFVRPGFSKPSYSRTFFSVFNKSLLSVDTNVHGGRRACIACGACTEVCPVAILPQLTYKSILANEVEMFLAHGLLDCVECGLCTYVCPSKIELNDVFTTAKLAYYRGT
jgi:Na+-transporting NADH:ubiquinone oxidoreductase subunit A